MQLIYVFLIGFGQQWESRASTATETQEQIYNMATVVPQNCQRNPAVSCPWLYMEKESWIWFIKTYALSHVPSDFGFRALNLALQGEVQL